MATASVDDILSRHESGNTRRLENNFDPRSLRPIRLKADSSEQYNPAASEALRVLAQRRALRWRHRQGCASTWARP